MGDNQPGFWSKDGIVAQLRREKEQQRLFLRTVEQAAVLAGEQVQDVRLDLLEDPPPVSTAPILLDILLQLALGPLAGLAIRKFADVGVDAILAARVGSAKRNGVFALAPFTSASLEKAETAFLAQSIQTQADLLMKKDKLDYWKEFAGDVQGVARDIVQDKAKSAIAGDNADLALPGVRQGGDTASVAVRRAALTFTRLQEPVIELVFAQYESRVQSETISNEDLFAIVRFLFKLGLKRATDSGKSNVEIERRLSLFFEACIWKLHFRAIVDTYTHIEPHGDYQHRIERGREKRRKVVVSPKLLRYWLLRLPHHEGNGTESYFEKRTGMQVAERAPLVTTSIRPWTCPSC